MAETYALAGNPNCGKTTLFNRLTKSHQHIGNWAGVTVEHKKGFYYKNKAIEIIDLPGIYSLSPLTLDEIVSRNYLLDQSPDVIIDVVDATNLERNLYLTTQLLSLDCKVVIALNMCDEARRLGLDIDTAKLQERFGCPVVAISAVKNEGLDELMRVCAASSDCRHVDMTFDETTEQALLTVGEKLCTKVTDANMRWYLIKLLEGDGKIVEKCGLDESQREWLREQTAAYSARMRERADIAIANQRYDYITRIVEETVKKELPDKPSVSDKIDRVLTNKWLAIPIFAAIMFVIFYISIQSLGQWTVDGMKYLVERLQDVTRSAMDAKSVVPWLTSLIVDGILNGVGNIIAYVPQIMILFGFISLLEASGYMARVAFIMDRIFRGIGLSGQSLIPMIVGCGCTVPGIMSARTIKNRRERRATIMLVPFMPCSAKLVLFAFFSSAVFGGNALVATSMYFVSIAVIIVGGLLLKGIFRRTDRSEDDTFVMELPPYRLPRPLNVLKDMWDKGKGFLIKAGTIIFAASVILWFLQNFNFRFRMVEDPSASMIAGIGKVIAPLFLPLGFGDWKYAVATLSGLAAKETVVVTLELVGGLQMSAASAYSFMVFNLLCFPCLGAISASFKELGKAREGLVTLLFQFVTAYLVSLLIYQASRLLGAYPTVFWSLIAGAVVLACAGISFALYRKSKKAGYGCSGDCAACGKCVPPHKVSRKRVRRKKK